ncbi:MAG: hypothetical protein ACRED1_11500, partial [Limisphaerales bacterium]
ISSNVPASAHDAYTEMVGFPARVLAETGLIFMADRNAQLGIDAAHNQTKITRLRADLENRVKNFNTKVAGGKWNHIMPGLVTGRDLDHWSSQVRWPWGEKTSSKSIQNNTNNPPAGQGWRDAAAADGQSSSGSARWSVIEGLGPSGRAVALEPAALQDAWTVNDKTAPALEYDFSAKGGDAAAFVDFPPTFRICPEMKLRVAVCVDDGAPRVIEVPGSSGKENENGAVRSNAVQDNYVRVRIPLPNLAAGHHTFSIRAMDPGAVIDCVSLP